VTRTYGVSPTLLPQRLGCASANGCCLSSVPTQGPLGAGCRSAGPFISLTHQKDRVGEAEHGVPVTPARIFDKTSQMKTIPSEDDVTVADAASERPLRQALAAASRRRSCRGSGRLRLVRRPEPTSSGYGHCVEKLPDLRESCSRQTSAYRAWKGSRMSLTLTDHLASLPARQDLRPPPPQPVIWICQRHQPPRDRTT